MPFSLNALLARKEREVRHKKLLAPVDVLMSRPFPPRRDFASALAKPGIAVIAEMKRKSPSAGLLRAHYDPRTLARGFETASAAALSVLTDRDHFGGSEGDIALAKRECGLPVLRKEFIIDEYQIAESRAIGADAVLLIARILSEARLRLFLDIAESLGLDCLVETHDEREVETAVRSGASIIGVNNRNLATLETDIGTSLKLAAALPKGVIRVSESGIRTPADALMLRDAGFDALLIGEALLREGTRGMTRILRSAERGSG
jgi:indole-3-glycerol phosphate synthase